MSAAISFSIHVNISVKILLEAITVNVIKAICYRVIKGLVKVCYVDFIQ